MSHGIGTETPAVGLEITDAPGEIREIFKDAIAIMDEKGRTNEGSRWLWARDWDFLRDLLFNGFQLSETTMETTNFSIETDGNAGIGSGGHDWPLVVDSLVRDGN